VQNSNYFQTITFMFIIWLICSFHSTHKQAQ